MWPQLINLCNFGPGMDLYGPPQTLVLQPTSAGFDAMITSTNPTGNNAGLITIRVGDDNAGGSRTLRTVFKFDLSTSGIAATALIVSATVGLFESAALNDGGPASWEVQLRRLLQNWVESQVTWNIYSTGNNWDAAGASTDGVDRAAANSATATLDGTAANAFINFDVTDDVAGFIDGSLSNYGWLIQAPALEGLGTHRAYNFFDSSDGATQAQHPKLTIVYREKKT